MSGRSKYTRAAGQPSRVKTDLLPEYIRPPAAGKAARMEPRRPGAVLGGIAGGLCARLQHSAHLLRHI